MRGLSVMKTQTRPTENTVLRLTRRVAAPCLLNKYKRGMNDESAVNDFDEYIDSSFQL